MSRPVAHMSARIARAWHRRVAEVFDTQDAYDTYMEKHPNADKSLHSVAPAGDSGKVTLPKSPPDPGLLDFVKEDDTAVGRVLRDVADKKPPTHKQVDQAKALVDRALRGDVADHEVERLQALQEMLEDLVGTEKEKDQGKDTKTPSILTPEDMTDAERDKEKAEREEKAKEKSPGDIKRDFIRALKDPAEQKRYRAMSDGDFMEMMKALDKGKKADLRERIVRLAYASPHLRPHLLPILSGG